MRAGQGRCPRRVDARGRWWFGYAAPYVARQTQSVGERRKFPPAAALGLSRAWPPFPYLRWSGPCAGSGGAATTAAPPDTLRPNTSSATAPAPASSGAPGTPPPVVAHAGGLPGRDAHEQRETERRPDLRRRVQQPGGQPLARLAARPRAGGRRRGRGEPDAQADGHERPEQLERVTRDPEQEQGPQRQSGQAA